ncbi:hypothetical protein CR513_50973, partial [Mucuna pruriens]
MCINYSDLNKACPKGSYPLPRIDWLIDETSSFQVLSFFDAYFGYNQVKMYPSDTNKTAFMTDGLAYYNQVMPFDLKNVGTTYQHLMDKVFANHIVRNLEVYMNNMVVKSLGLEERMKDFEEIFTQVRKYDMRLNPGKCVFDVRGGKFLGFMYDLLTKIMFTTHSAEENR